MSQNAILTMLCPGLLAVDFTVVGQSHSQGLEHALSGMAGFKVHYDADWLFWLCYLPFEASTSKSFDSESKTYPLFKATPPPSYIRRNAEYRSAHSMSTGWMDLQHPDRA